jgi:hypothetical protein
MSRGGSTVTGFGGLTFTVAIASVSCHVDKSHLVSFGIGAANVAQFHERAVFECRKGDNFLPGAQAHNVTLGDDLQDDFFGNSHHYMHSPHSGGWGPT